MHRCRLVVMSSSCLLSIHTGAPNSLDDFVFGSTPPSSAWKDFDNLSLVGTIRREEIYRVVIDWDWVSSKPSTMVKYIHIDTDRVFSSFFLTIFHYMWSYVKWSKGADFSSEEIILVSIVFRSYPDTILRGWPFLAQRLPKIQIISLKTAAVVAQIHPL